MGSIRRFRVAGDDVDVCWRLRQRGWTLGFSPAAVVWHHRRTSIRAYWKQQRGYGRAEALLERNGRRSTTRWPYSLDRTGLQGGALQGSAWSRERIYQGTWGSALFQSIYQPPSEGIWSLPAMPEWYLVILARRAIRPRQHLDSSAPRTAPAGAGSRYVRRPGCCLGVPLAPPLRGHRRLALRLKLA